MTQDQALQVLVQAVNLAQSKGAFNLQEPVHIAKAIEAFNPQAKTEEVETTKED